MLLLPRQRPCGFVITSVSGHGVAWPLLCLELRGLLQLKTSGSLFMSNSPNARSNAEQPSSDPLDPPGWLQHTARHSTTQHNHH